MAREKGMPPDDTRASYSPVLYPVASNEPLPSRPWDGRGRLDPAGIGRRRHFGTPLELRRAQAEGVRPEVLGLNIDPEWMHERASPGVPVEPRQWVPAQVPGAAGHRQRAVEDAHSSSIHERLRALYLSEHRRYLAHRSALVRVVFLVLVDHPQRPAEQGARRREVDRILGRAILHEGPDG